jgi:queuine tRNA-ribosyltransferase
MQFQVDKKDQHTKARAGIIKTSHGKIHTPIFMPVGTQGSVKTVTPKELKDAGVQIILGNTYHLYLRPGDALIQKAGGLHAFMNWELPILTDSGGYQVFSLSELRKITDDCVRFQSHIDGSYHTFTPESVVNIQRNLGSDIMMVLDVCIPYPCTYEGAAKANERTVRWAERSLSQYEKTQTSRQKKSLFGILQGSTYEPLRRISALQLIDLDFDGYAIGGLAVGEPRTAMLDTTDFCTDLLPEDKPRYLMGVGKPQDIVDAIALGVDMFDCVIPTRNGRNGTVFTWDGPITIKNRQFYDNFKAIDDRCGCYTCRQFSRAYIRHLFQSGEILALRLATIHNLYFYMELVKKAREAILHNEFDLWRIDFYQKYANHNHEHASNVTKIMNKGG